MEDGEFRTDWKSVYLLTVVSFMGAVHMICVSPGIWPYLQKMDPTVTETFFGLLRSASSCGGIVAVLISGYVANKFLNTKWPLVISKALAVLSCVIYLSVELWHDSRKMGFLLFELLLGVSMGASNLFRAHIAAVTTEADRPRAVAITSLAPSLGLIVSPIGQMAFTMLGYPGLDFVFGIHLNLFTAPIVLALSVATIGFILLVCCFDGRMPIPEKKEKATKPPMSTNSSTAELLNEAAVNNSSMPELQRGRPPVEVGFDWVAVLVCFFTKMTTMLTMQNFMTVGHPYSMMVFKWTSREAVIYQSISMGLIGLMVILMNCAYIFFNLRKKLSERRAVLISLFGLATYYLVTYQWPFIDGTIDYRNESISFNGSTPSQTADEDRSHLGCPLDYAWCASTPAVNMWVYLLMGIFAWGLAMPLCNLNLEVLYSKVLGPIPQGTMQGWFTVCGDVLSIVSPLLLSKIYVMTGPVYIWRFQLTIIASCILLWLYYYKRMISFSQRPVNL
ncbi:Protein Y53G8AR.7 a [Aphelenchoides avenae]|nr:Protein Y53G8AR.7 a [Aphelenchus avenae]